MDGTANPKLEALARAFRKEKGEVYIGVDAWNHLEALAGDTMSRFLELYVRGPIQDLLDKAGDRLLEFTATWEEKTVKLRIGSDVLHINRHPDLASNVDEDPLPNDVDAIIPGP